MRLREIWLRVKALMHREQLARDLDDEVAFHLAMREQKNRATGSAEDEARYAARRQFGNTTQLKERTRDIWTFPSWESFWQDVRYAARVLRKNPGFSAIAIATLALGIGANAALFSVVKAVLLNSLPYPQADRLVTLAQGKVSFGEAEDWKARNRSFQQIALYRGWTPTLSGAGHPEMVFGLRVTHNFFGMLGSSPFLGRFFSPEEDAPTRWHVVVLSYPYWVRRFGGNSNIVGQTILLDQIPFQVIGVLPQTFQPLSFNDAGSPPDAWAPLGYDATLPYACRTCRHLQSVARLNDSVSVGQWTPADIPRLQDVRVDLGVLLFAIAVSTGTGILMGLVPALQASRANHRDAMQRSSRNLLGTNSKFRGALVCSEICLAFVLCASAGLLLKSFLRAWNVDPGFQPQSLFEINFSLVGAKYSDNAAVVRAQSEVIERVQQIPGVDFAAIASTPPAAGGFGGFDQASFVIQDRRLPDPEVPSVDRYIVSSGYLRAAGIPLLRGRFFTEADTAATPPVAVISEMTARQIFAVEDLIGRRIQIGGRRDTEPWATIVGIVGDIHQYGLDSPATPQAYLLYSQFPFNYANALLVRSSVAPQALTRTIEERIWAIDKNTLVFNPSLITDLLEKSLAERRFAMSLLSAFGTLALLLAAIGVYGVMSCVVAQRTNEIGIRVALGASSMHIARMVLQEALLLAVLAVVVGLAASLAMSAVLRGFLFGIGATDPATLAIVSCTVLGIAALAALLPARRALRVDPTVALRVDPTVALRYE